MKLCLETLPDSLIVAAREAAAFLKLSVSEKGAAVLAKRGACLRVIGHVEGVEIVYSRTIEFFRALAVVKKNWRQKNYIFSVTQKPRFEHFGVMLDCSRNAVKSVAFLKDFILHMATLGYDQLQLYTEDTYEIDGEPYFGYLRGRYTATEIAEIDAWAQKFGIELIPCIQTLAHLKQIFRWNRFRPLRDAGATLLADEEETYALIDKMLATVAANFKSRKVHIGMDEAEELGRGKFLDLYGAADRTRIMLRHLRRVAGLCRKHGLQPMMWSDMFFRLAFGGQYCDFGSASVPDEVIAAVPDNVKLVYWDYYHTEKECGIMLEKHAKFSNETIFAGGAWAWTGFTPHNAYGIAQTEGALGACIKKGVKQAFMTVWACDGAEASAYSVLPTLTAAAETAYGSDERAAMLEAVTGVSESDFMRLDLANALASNRPEAHCNPSKYMLYSDCFAGIFDAITRPEDGDIYAAYVERLGDAERRAGRYVSVFKTQRVLCEVLRIKYGLGVRTRLAYSNEDIDTLKRLLKDCYQPLPEAIGRLYTALEQQWDAENKPQGFEVIDLRFGGLISRVKRCARQLERYISGQTAEIAELEQTLLDPDCGSGEKRFVEFNYHSRNVSAGAVTP